ncbi:hypothetical protein HKCCE4037_06350 [Rhodobacterales bacterium HKCCE4037]|nr:hypothetical protein [Rhodobacterales bacterium HKCCE4037]
MTEQVKIIPWVKERVVLVLSLIALTSALSTALVTGTLTYLEWRDLPERTAALEEIVARAEADRAMMRETLQRIEVQLERQSRAIELLRAPTRVVYYDPATGPEGEWSRSAGRGLLVVVANREEGAEDCVIIPDATVITITSDADLLPRTANRVDGRTARNLTDRREGREIVVGIPAGTPLGRATVTIQTFYERCPWQDNEGRPPVPAISPPIDVEIVP